jgi:hypothetical protein
MPPLPEEGLPRGNRFARKFVLSMWAYCLITWGSEDSSDEDVVREL